MGKGLIGCVPSSAKFFVRPFVNRLRRSHPEKVKVIVRLKLLNLRVKNHDRRIARENAEKVPVEQQMDVGP